MNTIWLKIAGGVVLALALLIGVASFMGGDSSEAPEPQEEKTFQDTVEEDRKRHPVIAPEPIAEEKFKEEKPQEAPPVETVTVAKKKADPKPEPETPKVIYVKPMDEAEEMQAQKLLSWAGTTYSAGRLPVMQYGNAVRSCRDVINRWPESWYAYQSKRILAEIADISRRYRQQYKLDDEILDVSKFYEKRPRTQAVPIEN